MVQSVTFLLTSILLFTGPTESFGQLEKRPTFYASGGITVPLNPETLPDVWKTGRNFGGAVSYPLDDQLGVQLLANYSTFKIDQDALLTLFGLGGSGISLSGGDANILTVTAGIKVDPQPPTSAVSVYGVAGVGFIKLSTKDLSGPTGAIPGPQAIHNTGVGPGVGMGFDLMLGERFSIFVEAQYYMGLNEGESTQLVPIRLGLSFQ